MSKPLPSTLQHRIELLKQLLDSDQLTNKDKLAIYYCSWRIEWAISRRRYHQNHLNKYGTRMNNYVTIHNFATDLEKLT
jgi:hypothetical protein